MRLTKNTEIIKWDDTYLTVKNKRGKITEIVVDGLEYDTWIEFDEYGDKDYDKGVLQVIKARFLVYVDDENGQSHEKVVKADVDFKQKFSEYLCEMYDWGEYMESYYEAQKEL